MVAKLSSVSTIVDASRATSVPERPIATPMWARCRAGASLTPSPVMATIWPWARRASATLQFGLRRGAGEDDLRCPAEARSSSSSWSGDGLGLCHDVQPGRADADLAGDGGGGDAVVAGHDVDAEAGLVAAPHRVGDLRPRRVVQSDQAEQAQPRLRVLAPARRVGAGGESHVWRRRGRACPAGRAASAAAASAAAVPSPTCQHGLRRALDDDAQAVLASSWTRTSAAAGDRTGTEPGYRCPVSREVERGRVSRAPRPGRSPWGRRGARRRSSRAHRRALALVRTSLAGPRGRSPVPCSGVHSGLQPHAVLRQGPGLVRADDVGGAQGLDGAQPFDDGALAGEDTYARRRARG